MRGLFEQLRTIGNDGAHGREVPDPVLPFQCAQTLTLWYVGHAGAATIASHERPELGITGWRDFEAPRWQRRLSRTAETPRLFLVRAGDKTTVLHEHDGIVEAFWYQMPTLLFGEGRHVWEQDATTTRVVVAAKDLGDYWDVRDGASVPLAYVPTSGLQLVNLATGVTHATDPLALAGWKPGSAQLPPLALSRDSRSLVSVGPWYLSLDTVYGYAGGAHGGSGCFFDAFDVTGVSAQSALLTAVRDVDRQHPELRQQALTAWPEERETNELDDTPELTIHRFEFTYAEDGRLGLAVDYTGDIHYSASDGRWDDYTRSVIIHTTALPPALQAYAEMPEAVFAWFNANREDFGGWSELDLTALPLLTARFDEYR